MVPIELNAVFSELAAGATAPSAGKSSAFRYDRRRITRALADDLITAGVDQTAIRAEQRASESARYRLSSPLWDLVLVAQGIPVVVIEWKTITSRSRNNYSNRLDELVAAATALRASFTQADAASYQPRLACLFFADTPDVYDANSSVETDKRLENLSSFAAPLRSMISDGLLDCACILRFDTASQTMVDFSEDLGFKHFSESIVLSARTPHEKSGAPDFSAEVGRLLSHGNARGFASGLASTAAGQTAVEAATIEKRRNKIRELQELAAAEGTTELEMQKAIGSNYWIFGGQHTGLAPRDLVKLDQHDFALISADESLHIIELKRPDAKLTEQHRSHYIVSDEVHKAVSQCLNYLRALDEQGASMQSTWHNERGLDIDFRRAKGTVVIGDLSHANFGGAARFQAQQAIRSYNAHLSRVQVTTYSELLESADRVLRFEINPGKE